MAEQKTQHTPLEWSEVYFRALHERHIRYYSNSEIDTIAILNCGDNETDKANAEFIVKACNNYEPMLQALKAFQAIIDLMMDDIKAKGHIAPHHLSDFRVVRQNALDVIKQAETPKNVRARDFPRMIQRHDVSKLL